LTRQKGHDARQARPGNKNSKKGPRIGRHEPVEPVVVPAASPPVVKIRQRPKRRKTGGRDFPKAHNSHTSEVFRRGPDHIPRQDAAVMGRVVMNDFRKAIYDNLAKFVNTPRGAFAFYQDYRDRTEGLPTKKVAVAKFTPGATFVFTDKDGNETPALPERVGNGATPAASAQDKAEEALILAGMRVVPPPR